MRGFPKKGDCPEIRIRDYLQSARKRPLRMVVERRRRGVVLAKVRGALRALVTETLRPAEDAVCTPRQAARDLAEPRRDVLPHRPGAA
ncbi:hypothetical protein ACFWA5_35255 [Streptomyces mirabilis]|uniref:hypothetical protein n=1 Tax=Streptomyces mirabilis TaxID=68239 RepID=UPI003664D76F